MPEQQFNLYTQIRDDWIKATGWPLPPAEYPDPIYDRLLRHRPLRMLECGVCYGQSTLAILPYCKENDLVLLSCDIAHPGSILLEFIEKYELAKNWCFVMQDDLVLAEYLHNCGATLDFIYVDTSHTYDQTRKELEKLWPLLRVGGIMMWDDFTFGGEHQGITEWVQKNRLQFDYMDKDFFIVEKPSGMPEPNQPYGMRSYNGRELSSAELCT